MSRGKFMIGPITYLFPFGLCHNHGPWDIEKVL